MANLPREYYKAAAEFGFFFERQRKHTIFKHASGAIVIAPAKDSGSWRDIKNFKCNLAKATKGLRYNNVHPTR
jgi:predicted RNA binding protein YcfA (HicA-like mRNA interferase family)